MEGCSTISMDISPSNQCLGFGDTANWIHLYSSVPEPVLNPFARPTEFADEVGVCSCSLHQAGMDRI